MLFGTSSLWLWSRNARRWGGEHRKPVKIQPTGLLKAKKNNYYPPEKRAFLQTLSKPRHILQMKDLLFSSLLLTPCLFLSSVVPKRTNCFSAVPKITKLAARLASLRSGLWHGTYMPQCLLLRLLCCHCRAGAHHIFSRQFSGSRQQKKSVYSNF